MSRHLLIREGKKVISLQHFLIACIFSTSPVHKAAGIDRPTALSGWSPCQLLIGSVTGMAIKHLLSVSLQDGCLTRFQLASLAAPLSTDDKHQHASTHKIHAKNYQSSASVGVDLCDRVISILEKTFSLILILVLQCLFQRIHFPSLRIQ